MTVNVLHRWLSLRVSIHTPIQGVTYRFMDNIYILHVSIHTPIQGVTSIAQKMMLSLISFNPHTHTGCDRRWAERSVLRGSFNPHTHTGCDKISTDNLCTINVSIHTPIQGVTDVYSNVVPDTMFQSTHPYRV